MANEKAYLDLDGTAELWDATSAKVTEIRNELNPTSLRTSINTGSANGRLYAYKIGRLVFVVGTIEPRVTGVELALATIHGVRVVNTGMCAQVGGYANSSEEVYIIPSVNDTVLRFNTTTTSILKLNFCFICN